MRLARTFPYAERAAAAREAMAAIRPTFAAVTDRWNLADPNTIAWKHAIATAWAAIDAAYPPGYRAAFEDLRAGDGSGIDLLIAFLEADPMFFRSGYEKERLLQRLKRAPLEPEQAERLRGVVTLIVRTRDAREFRYYCRLAHRVDAPALRATLAGLAADPDNDQRRRATWMLDSLDHAARAARGRQANTATP